jgi:hypothetical protein
MTRCSHLHLGRNALPESYTSHAVYYEVKREAYAKILAAVEPTLSPYNRNFASNIELLRKSKEDSRIDAALRGSMNRPDNSFDRDVDNAVPANVDLDAEEPLDAVNEFFSTKALITAYHSITMSWRKESLVAGQRIPALLSRASQVRPLPAENLLPFDIFTRPTLERKALIGVCSFSNSFHYFLYSKTTLSSEKMDLSRSHFNKKSCLRNHYLCCTI